MPIVDIIKSVWVHRPGRSEISFLKVGIYKHTATPAIAKTQSYHGMVSLGDFLNSGKAIDARKMAKAR